MSAHIVIALLCGLICLSIPLYKARAMRAKVVTVEGWARAIRCMGYQLAVMRREFAAAAQEAAVITGEGQAADTLNRCAELILKTPGRSAVGVWRQSVKQYCKGQSYLQILESVSDIIGSNDVMDIEKISAEISTRISDMAQEMKTDMRRKQPLYIELGLLAGLAVAILLL